MSQFKYQEEKERWLRRRSKLRRKRELEIAERGSDWRAVHGEGQDEPGRKWTNSTRLNINDYGKGTASIRDVGVIKKRKD